MITTTILIPLLVSSGHAPAQQDQVRATPVERTAEDIEVLRRLIVQEISEQQKTDNSQPTVFSSGQNMGYTFRSLNDFTITGASRYVTNSRAFHIPSQGVFFSLDVQLPVIEAKPQQKEPVVEKSEAEEEWDRIRSEVRTGVSSRRNPFKQDSLFGVAREDNRTWELDPEAIDDVENAVLRILARHAGRIDGLQDSDRITVALHMTGSEGSFYVQTDENDEECTTSIAWLGGALAARRAPAQKLILQIPVSEVRRGDLNGGSELRQRALIHAY